MTSALAAALAPYDAASLAALASKGLVRRAERDVAAGLVHLREYADGFATFEADGEQVRIGAAGPAAASCTCPASGLCRHVLAATLVLAAGAAPLARAAGPAATAVDPLAEILALADADVAAWAGRPALRQAGTILAASGEPAIGVEGAALTVRLAPERPAVVWIAGGGLAGLICKAPAAKRKALLVAAILAVRRAHGLALPAEAESPAATAAAWSARPLDVAFLGEVDEALFAFVRSGFGPAPLSLEARLEDLAQSARAGALPRLAAQLRTLAARVREKRRRTATADPEATLALLAETFALATALRGAAQPEREDTERLANLRGRVREEFEAAGNLRLAGIGASLWSTRTGARGVTAYFYAPERERWFTATLARAGDADPSFRAIEAFRRETVWGTATLEQLAHAEVRLTGAGAAADGRLSLGKNVRAETSPLAGIAPAVQTWSVTFADWASLEGYLRAAAVPPLAAPRAERGVVLLRPKVAADPFAEPFTQRLIWPLADERGRWLALAVPDGAERDGLAAALVKLADRSRVACVAALATRRGPAFELRPFAVLRSEAEGDRFESLGLDESAPAGFGASFFARLAKRATALARGGPQRFVPVDPATSAPARALADAVHALVAIAELGGFDVTAAHARRLAAAGQALREAGFEALGAAVARGASAARADPAPFLIAAYLVTRAEGLAAGIPELRATNREPS